MDASTLDPRRNMLGRRTFLAGGLGALAAAALPTPAGATTGARARAGARTGTATTLRPGTLPLPPVIRSRQELAARGIAPAPSSTAFQASTLPITPDGTTFQMAQDTAWVDDHHFAVGRWDGSMSIFEYGAAPFGGPLIHEAVTSPAFAGVRMVAPLPGNALASANDDASIVLWWSPSGGWTDLTDVRVYGYDPALGAATSGLWVQGGAPSTLVVGHAAGFASIWKYNPAERKLALRRTVDLRNPTPVNPWGLHDIHGLDVVADSPSAAVVVTGSEDGYVNLVEVPSGTILSQTVFNPDAERGINSVSVRGHALLVANCSVGTDDDNLWYYEIDPQTWAVTLLDQANLIIDTDRVQVFNFHTLWGEYSDGPCWFASTEEGALWMGTAAAGLDVFGYQEVTSPLGSSLAYRGGPGRLTMVAYDLYQYRTGAA